MKYPRNEIWERKAYETLVRAGKLTVIFRPEDRICNGTNTKCFYRGEELALRILETPGDEDRGIKPVHDGLTRKVKVVKMDIIKIQDLKDSDFAGSSPDVQSQEQLRYHLGLIYNRTPESFKIVTKIELKYLD